LLEQLHDLAFLGMPVELGLLEYGPAIAQNFEPPALRRNQLDFRFRKRLPYLSRQPGGSGFIVSNRAVFDCDLHFNPSRLS
jgi:hypothetical protein